MTDHNEALRLAEWIEGDMSCQGDAEIASMIRQQAERIAELEAERDQLRAEVERLRADAERYQWLRGNQLLAKTQLMPTSPREYLDAAIDAARTTHKETE